MAFMTNPAVPEIAKQYENDYRTKIAQSLLQAGGNTSRLPMGKGAAWTEGIARLLSGVAGGIINKNQMKKYGALDDAAAADIQKSAGAAGGPAQADQVAAGGNTGPLPQPAPPPVAPPPPPPPQAMPQPMPTPVQPGMPAGPQGMPPRPMMPPQGQMPPGMPPRPAGGGIAGIQPGGPPGMPPAGQMPPGGPLGNVQAPEGRPVLSGPIPSGMIPADKARTLPSASTETPRFVDPLGGKGRATSGYGTRKPPIAGASAFHNGTDFAAPSGMPVMSAGDGVVIAAGFDKKHGGGNFVKIKHDDGSVTGYAHLANYDVETGMLVKAGQPIGAVGSTGRSTGAHLHFTVRGPDGKTMNPTKIQYAEAGGDPNVRSDAPPSGIPDMPPVAEAPQRPDTVAARSSYKKAMGERMLATGNKYLIERAMKMIDEGNAEQLQADESYASREQNTRDTGYQAGLQRANASANNREGAQYSERAAAQGFGYDMAKIDKQQVNDMAKMGYDRDTAFGLAKLNNDQEWKRTMAQIEASRATAADKAAAKRTMFFNTPTGAKIYDQSTNAINGNNHTMDQLDRFAELMTKTPTGGLNALPGVGSMRTWTNSELAEMESISQDMSIALSSRLKGAISDKEGERILKSIPDLRKPGAANTAMITTIKQALQRANEFEQYKLDAMAEGNHMSFLKQWQAYTNSTPLNSGKSFEDWKSSIPTYGADGKRK